MNPEPLILERSFVHVVKAAEPVFAAVLSAVFAGSVMALPVYASLIPVQGHLAHKKQPPPPLGPP